MTTINETKVRIKRHFNESDWTRSNEMKGLFGNTKTRLIAPWDIKTKGFKTGMTEEQARGLEKKLGLEKGTLSPHNKAYWAEWEIQIPTGGKELDLSQPSDELAYYILSARKDVATSTSDLRLKNTASNECVFLMTSEAVEAKEKNTKRNFLAKAMKIYGEMGPDEMRDILLYSSRYAFDVSAEVIMEKVGDLIEENPKKFCEMVESDSFRDTVFINKCLFYGILSRKGAAVYQGEEMIGIDMEQTINFFNNPKNSSAKVAVLASLQDREKGKPSKSK